MDERVQELEDVALVLPQDAQNDLTRLLEDAFLLENAERVHYITCKAEGHDFRDLELGTFFEDAVKVHMRHFASVLVDEDVVAVSVSETDYVANHRPYSRRFDKIVPGFVPYFGAGIVVCEPVAQYRLDVLLDFVPNLGVSVAHTQVCGFFLDFLHLTFDVILLPVVADDAFEGIGVLDPFDEARVATQRHDCISAQLQIPLASL